MIVPQWNTPIDRASNPDTSTETDWHLTMISANLESPDSFDLPFVIEVAKLTLRLALQTAQKT